MPPATPGHKAMLWEAMLWFEFGKCLNLMMYGRALGKNEQIYATKLLVLNINVNASIMLDKYKAVTALCHES